MGKTSTEYVKEKAFWGDLYIVRVYEEHKNTPGFAPETFDTHVCDIWLKYSDWERRIEFMQARVEHKTTLSKIAEIFSGKFDETKFTPTKENLSQENVTPKKDGK